MNAAVCKNIAVNSSLFHKSLERQRIGCAYRIGADTAEHVINTVDRIVPAVRQLLKTILRLLANILSNIQQFIIGGFGRDTGHYRLDFVIRFFQFIWRVDIRQLQCPQNLFLILSLIHISSASKV